MKIYTKIKSLSYLFATLLAIFCLFLLPQIVSAQTVRLGGMDLNSYCNSQGQGGVVLTNNIWNCQSGASINMTTACQWQYQIAAARASQDTPNNPYSWTCYGDGGITPTPAPPGVTPTPTQAQTRQGGMNLDGYCRSQNQGGSQLTNNVWRCQSGTTINLNAACQWQYQTASTAIQEGQGNPYTWACYTTTTTQTPTPTLAPTPTPTPTIMPTPTPAQRMRRNIYTLTPDELRRLTNAMNALRADGTYQRFSDLHMQAMMTASPPNTANTFRNVAHRGPAFLAWHRAFVNDFEDQLRRVDPSVSLPYWQFENESGSIPQVFSAAYFGGDGTISQGNRVTNGPFANWNIIRRIGRDPDGQPSLPPSSDIAAALNNTVYDSAPYNENSRGFNMSMEGWVGNNAPWGVHNRVHGYIGGDMITMGSADDPIFWLVHTNVDRLWWEWQLDNGINTYVPQNGGPAGHNLNDTMRFLNRPTTPANTLNIRNLGYDYN